MRRAVPLVLTSLIAANSYAADPIPFIRGDADVDGHLDITDPIRILRYLILQGDLACIDAADADDDGAVGISDASAVLLHLFAGGPPPPPPFPGCGLDPGEHDLGCTASYPCGYFGDGIFFCCDRSSSMANKLARAKNEITKNISAFSEKVEFGIVFFDVGLTVYPERGIALASQEAKDEALAFVAGQETGSGGCGKEGLFAALHLAERALGVRRSIIFISDGMISCPGSDAETYKQECLDAVTARNAGRFHINSLCIGPASEVDETFMRNIAAQNGGKYSRLVQ
jgi:hypothetical protein